MPRIVFDDKNISRGKNFEKVCKSLFPKASREKIGAMLGGVPGNTIKNWEKGGTIANRALVELERRGVSLTWLLTSEGKMLAGDAPVPASYLEKGEEMESEERSPHHLTIRNNLKKIRAKCGHESIWQICRDTGIDIDNWVAWENGDGWPTRGAMEQIALYVSIDPADIDKPLPEDEWPMPMPERYMRAPEPGSAKVAITENDSIDGEIKQTIQMCLSVIDSLHRLVHLLQAGGPAEEVLAALRTAREHFGTVQAPIETALAHDENRYKKT